MEGTVILINPRTGMFAVEIDGSDYAVIEIIDSGTVEVGDRIVGNLESLGGEDLRNQTQSETVSVFIQNIHCSRSLAAAMVGR